MASTAPAPHLQGNMLAPRFYTTNIAKAARAVMNHPL